ncbi:hypothetical protein MKW92_024602, partial [Papaver armeniacum]
MPMSPIFDSATKYKRVPSASIERPEGFGMIRALRYGFGHDSENDVYKMRGHLYGVLVNEAVHWVANPLSATLLYDGVRIILSFDVKNEMFKEVPQPQNLNEPNHITLGEFGRKLCLIDHDCHTVSVNFWVMNEYGRSESWTRQIIISLHTVIPSFKYVIPVQRFRNGEIILETDNGTLMLYNPKEENCRELNIRKFNKHFEVTTFVESLVSPKQITLVKQEQAGM